MNVAEPWERGLNKTESPNGAALTDCQGRIRLGPPLRGFGWVILPTQGCATFVSLTSLRPGLVYISRIPLCALCGLLFRSFPDSHLFRISCFGFHNVGHWFCGARSSLLEQKEAKDTKDIEMSSVGRVARSGDRPQTVYASYAQANGR